MVGTVSISFLARVMCSLRMTLEVVKLLWPIKVVSHIVCGRCGCWWKMGCEC